MQNLSLQNENLADSFRLHCIKCGHVQDPEISSYCEHVSFVFLPDYDFEYISPESEELIAKLQESVDRDDSTDMESMLVNLPSTKSSFIIEIGSAGFSCGPSSFRALYGFDLAI